MTTWAVHATVDEPVEILCAFVAHYLSMGASEVHLFLDRPSDEVVRVLGAVDRVRLTLCDDQYWARSNKARRPDFILERQKHNANAAYRQCRAGWLLFCDADEYVMLDRDLGEALGDLPPGQDMVRVRVAERAFLQDRPPATVFEGVFRKPIQNFPDIGTRLYGDWAEFFDRGLLGHVKGKAISRVGAGRKLRIHISTPADCKEETYILLRQPEYRNFLQAAALHHFDGMTPLGWALKLLGKSQVAQARIPEQERDADGFAKVPHEGHARQRQIREVYLARHDPARLLELVRLPILTAAILDRLRDIDAVLEIGPDPAGAARRIFPEAGLDFSVAAFDARLRSHHAGLIAQSGLAI